MLDLVLQKVKENLLQDSILNTGKNPVLILLWNCDDIHSIRLIQVVQNLINEIPKGSLDAIAVHEPDFAFQKNSKMLADETERIGLSLPQVQDDDNEIWNILNATQLPFVYMFDHEGSLLAETGSASDTKAALNELLDISKPELIEDNDERDSQYANVYLGSMRGTSIESLMHGKAIDKGKILNSGEPHIRLSSNWVQTPESILAVEKGCIFDINFYGSELYAVLDENFLKLATVTADNRLVHCSEISSHLICLATYDKNGYHHLEIRTEKNFEIFALTLVRVS